MKIEIILSEDINEECTGMTCFNADAHIRDKFPNCDSIKGVIIIDDTPIKFYFNPTFMDGDIFTKNSEHRLIIKYLIPLYVYNTQVDKSVKSNITTNRPPCDI